MLGQKNLNIAQMVSASVTGYRFVVTHVKLLQLKQ